MTEPIPPFPRRAFGLAGLLVLPALLPAGVTPVSAQLPLTEHTLRSDGAAPSPAASLDDVAWLTGRWTGEGLGGVVEESWLPPTGGAMVGVFRMTGEDGVRFYEIMILAQEGESLVLELKHFGPDLVGWEEREETVRFPLVARDGQTLWFDGLTLRRDGNDGLTVWVALGSEDDPEVREALFVYRRAGGGLREGGR